MTFKSYFLRILSSTIKLRAVAFNDKSSKDSLSHSKSQKMALQHFDNNDFLPLYSTVFDVS